MQENDINSGILITTDAYSKVMDKSDSKTNPLFGDGATASLIINSSIPSFYLGNGVVTDLEEIH